jgi:hypothetical protein
MHHNNRIGKERKGPEAKGEYFKGKPKGAVDDNESRT